MKTGILHPESHAMLMLNNREYLICVFPRKLGETLHINIRIEFDSESHANLPLHDHKNLKNLEQ